MLRGDYCIRKDLRSPYIVSMPSRLPGGKRPWKIFSFMCRKIVANPPPLCIITPVLTKPCALVAELVDALDSGSSGGSPVKVRVLSGAPNKAVQVNCLHGLTGFLRIAVSIQNGIRCGKTGHFFLQMTGVVLRGKLRPRGMNAERLSIVLQSIEKLKSHVPR